MIKPRNGRKPHKEQKNRAPSRKHRTPPLIEVTPRRGNDPVISDRLTPADCVNVETYRTALQREYIRRMGGATPPLSDMAKRLGISVSTLRKYHKNLGVKGVKQADGTTRYYLPDHPNHPDYQQESK